MWKDEIVEEVRQARDEFAAKFDHDMDAIYREVKKQESESERKFVSFPPKPVEVYERSANVLDPRS